MTLTSLVLMIGAIGLALTMLIKLVFKADQNLLVSYFQNFCGALFIFSGWVKAIDPLGTAYKMEQYFGEFESTFEGTWMSFLAPMFPWLSEFAIGFSVFMIVFEIVLGLMLIIGARPKFTAWAFFALVAFFTVLTGFTYLTGYVPQGVNFFEFGKWGPYVETNMKVTDCGCFGDFLKLKPKVSFFKDIFLLFPALLFVFKYNKMHQLFGKGLRTALTVGSLGLVTLYCLSNYVWDLPHTDFRPFSKGAEVAEIKKKEEVALSNVQVTHYTLTNKSSGESTTIPYAQFLKDYKNYPKEEWDYEQVTTKPEIEPTKISDFAVTDIDGNDVTEDILSDPNYSVMIVCYKYYYDSESRTTTVQDTTFVSDTIRVADTIQQIVERVGEIKSREVTREVYLFEKDYADIFKQKITPFAEAAEKAGLNVYGVVGGAGSDMINDFRHETQSPYPYYEADDILLKTIVRSNPGVVLWKNGKIIDKWHHKKLPTFEEVQASVMK
ncbi:MAG: DoxX family protein [Bacteroidota bacterium]